MELNILNESKDEIEFQIDNLTLVELLRIYLSKDSGVDFVAWKRVHPTEAPILKFKTKGKTVKKAINDAVALATKDLEKAEKDFAKLK